MKARLVVCALVMFSWGKNEGQDKARTGAQGETRIQEMIPSLYQGFAKAYNERGPSSTTT